MPADDSRFHAASCPRLAVSVNGQLRATAGLGRHGVLTAMVAHHGEDPAAAGQDPASDADADPATWLDLGGFDPESDEYPNWLSGEALRPGDVVVIEVLPPGDYDPPARVKLGAEARGRWEQEQGQE